MNSPIQWSFSLNNFFLLTSGLLASWQLAPFIRFMLHVSVYSHSVVRRLLLFTPLIQTDVWWWWFDLSPGVVYHIFERLGICGCINNMSFYLCGCIVLSECLSPLTWTTTAWSTWPALVMCSWTPPSPRPVSVWALWFPSAPSRSSPG